jgi:hypothetical protein
LHEVRRPPKEVIGFDKKIAGDGGHKVGLTSQIRKAGPSFDGFVIVFNLLCNQSIA